ncbi:hypothetical protein LEP1GSC163_0017 [Leptospira santarosai str. CBC379]|uniref:Uncharacterized protein n=1 Tax=Leptospira santarosai str. MOR084 TaxID=1049984 RepID=A0A0E2BP28_9LEPT|nr:hypothetical protein LEP1GSC179_3834 [Leptospira santarosai str. MOR084]EKR89647.1 hypothetical protein LEP1GSC163_0017 [Leptospira santarosai str. CBC379]
MHAKQRHGGSAIYSFGPYGIDVNGNCCKFYNFSFKSIENGTLVPFFRNPTAQSSWFSIQKFPYPKHLS